MVKGLIFKAGNDATLRLEIEDILDAQFIQEMAVERGGFRMSFPYVLIKGTNSIQLT